MSEINRNVEWFMFQGATGSHLSLVRPGCSEACPLEFCTSLRMEILQSAPVFDHPCGENSFPYIYCMCYYLWSSKACQRLYLISMLQFNWICNSECQVYFSISL